MAFNTGSTVVAKLTNYGRAALASGSGIAITKFSIGDSDADYYASLTLEAGRIPSMGGNKSTISGVTNNSVNLSNTTTFRSNIYSKNNSIYKTIEPGSLSVITQQENIGSSVISSTTITVDNIKLTALTKNSLVNLYSAFRLPITPKDFNRYTGVTYTSGGWSDTALSGIASTNIISMSIPYSEYGEILDGKEILVRFTGTSATAYKIYATFQNKQTSKNIDNNKFTETSTQTTEFGQNYAFLFSDQIKKPNNDSTKSWATGFGTVKPYSSNGKERYNLTANGSLNQITDKAVGIAYLDKGIMVITDSTIVSDYNTGSTASATISYNSASTNVSQDIICILGRGEYTTSNNYTFTNGDTIRMSEIGLYDVNNNLIAYGKTNRHITKTPNEIKVLSIKINY